MPSNVSGTLTSSPWLRRVLHRVYHTGTRINHFARRRLRPAGIGLFVVGIVLICFAGSRADSTLFLLFSFSFSLGALSLAWLPFRKATLRIHREVPQHATAGETVKIRYHVENLSQRRIRNAWLVETPPDPRPTRQQFLQAHEPGEEQRNAFDRTFSYYCWNWLCEKQLAFDAFPTLQSLDLQEKSHQTLTAELVPRRRGLIHLNDLRLILPDPLGLFQRCRPLAPQASTLAVLPRRYRLPSFQLPGAARFQPGGDAETHNNGPSGEFVGLRDYQPGDPLRLIHWQSWARTGKPVTKELEDTYFPRHGLILDTTPAEMDQDLFEEAVSVAASFVSSIDTQECLIELMFISGQERVITAGRGTGNVESLLEVLAGVETSEKTEAESLRNLVLRHAEDLAGCLAVIAGWSENRRELIESLSLSGIEIAALVVCRELPAERPPGVYFVRSSHLAADLMSLPSNL
ncbi:MAG: DUF58 domain-containing protein [Verrucomicrobiales bacterium]